MCIRDRYYFDEETREMKTGFVTHHSNQYYYDKQGRMQYGEMCIRDRYVSAKSGQRLPKLYDMIDMVIANQTLRVATGCLLYTSTGRCYFF